MHNDSRKELIQALEELSVAYPEWRFGQMIANLALVAKGANDGAIWDMEDDELLVAIRWQLQARQDSSASVI